MYTYSYHFLRKIIFALFCCVLILAGIFFIQSHTTTLLAPHIPRSAPATLIIDTTHKETRSLVHHLMKNAGFSTTETIIQESHEVAFVYTPDTSLLLFIAPKTNTKKQLFSAVQDMPHPSFVTQHFVVLGTSNDALTWYHDHAPSLQQKYLTLRKRKKSTVFTGSLYPSLLVTSLNDTTLAAAITHIPPLSFKGELRSSAIYLTLKMSKPKNTPLPQQNHIQEQVQHLQTRIPLDASLVLFNPLSLTTDTATTLPPFLLALGSSTNNSLLTRIHSESILHLPLHTLFSLTLPSNSIPHELYERYIRDLQYRLANTFARHSTPTLPDGTNATFTIASTDDFPLTREQTASSTVISLSSRENSSSIITLSSHDDWTTLSSFSSTTISAQSPFMNSSCPKPSFSLPFAYVSLHKVVDIFPLLSTLFPQEYKYFTLILAKSSFSLCITP